MLEDLAEARRRDELRAVALGTYTPVAQQLDLAAEHAELWREMTDLLALVVASGPDHLAIPAQRLLEKITRL